MNDQTTVQEGSAACPSAESQGDEIRTPQAPLDAPSTSNTSTPKFEANEFGAVREVGVAGSRGSQFPARYELISTIGLRRVAETYGEGAIKYGDDGWLKGFDQKGLLNHALAHLNLYRSGDKTEDHLAHATWNLITLMHFEETRPDLLNLFQGIPEGQHR